MNRLNLGIGRVLLALCTVSLLGGPAIGQSELERIVDEGQMSWLVGRWTAATDEGQTIELAYRWQLDKNMISVYFKMGGYAYQGMIFCVPGQEKVIEVGVDNKGSTVNCEWDVTWDGAVSKREVSQGNGQKESMAMATSKIDKDTMKVRLYAMEYGNLAGDPWAALQFKRQPVQRSGGRQSTGTDEK
ncbi:MAG: hypothetical protein IH624_04015 [Phycisphaerae bacterium]|nr:hypothetical protein [Phycisphaerae bacterium]